MVFWSINFFARGIRLGSLLLDQTGRPPVKQRANELWTSKVGIPWWGVAKAFWKMKPYLNKEEFSEEA